MDVEYSLNTFILELMDLFSTLVQFVFQVTTIE